MKNLGYLLIAIGFLGGALASVTYEEKVQWGYYVTAVGVGVAATG